MKSFNAYLQSYNGERKVEHKANVIIIDVSKFLKYSSPNTINWLAVTEPQKVRQYLDHLEQRSAI